jgi:hypothetical protein
MDATAPNALDTTTSEQSGYVPSNATNDSANGENGNGECQANRTTNDVAHGADDWHSDGVDEEIRGANPEGFSG